MVRPSRAEPAPTETPMWVTATPRSRRAGTWKANGRPVQRVSEQNQGIAVAEPGIGRERCEIDYFIVRNVQESESAEFGQRFDVANRVVGQIESASDSANRGQAA